MSCADLHLGSLCPQPDIGTPSAVAPVISLRSSGQYALPCPVTDVTERERPHMAAGSGRESGVHEGASFRGLDRLWAQVKYPVGPMLRAWWTPGR